MSWRILLFFPSVDRGGCEEYALVVGKEAGKRGYITEVCFPQVARTRSLRADFERAGIPVHPWPPCMHAPPGSWGTFDEQRREALALLAKIRPDRVWMALPWVDSAVGFLAACGEAGVRGLCVWQLATETVSIPVPEAAAARKSLQRGLPWVAVSRNNRAFIARSYRLDQARIRVVYDGLLSSTGFAYPSPELRARYRAEVREELGLPPHARIVITVARLCLEQKAQDLLLAAIKKLGHLDHTYFVWVGDGEDRAYLERMIAAAGLQGSVLMLGFRSDVARLLVAADLFVLPSNLEGMPFTIFEALACGCPVVATRVGGNPEVLRHEHDALLIPPRDADELARAIDRVMKDEALLLRLVRNGYDTVQRHTPQAMLSESFSLLEGAPGMDVGISLKTAVD